jgi:hypothetical protein
MTARMALRSSAVNSPRWTQAARHSSHGAKTAKSRRLLGIPFPASRAQSCIGCAGAFEPAYKMPRERREIYNEMYNRIVENTKTKNTRRSIRFHRTSTPRYAPYSPSPASCPAEGTECIPGGTRQVLLEQRSMAFPWRRAWRIEVVHLTQFAYTAARYQR